MNRSLLDASRCARHAALAGCALSTPAAGPRALPPAAAAGPRALPPAAAAAATIAAAGMLALLLAWSPRARAHEGHDHGGATKAVVAASLLPRAVAGTDAVEMVAVLEGQRLLLWFDHAPTNAPVLGAEVEVEIGGVSHAAPAGPDGVHVVSLAAAPAAGTHTLNVTLQAGELADLLSATLELAAPAAAATPATAAGAAMGWAALAAAAGGGALAAGALVAALMRRGRRAAVAESGQQGA